MDSGFQYFDHTADVGMKVWSENWETLFYYAAKGMVSLVVDLDSVLKKENKTVYIQSREKEELLLFWLREILFQMESCGMLFSEFQIETDTFSSRKEDFFSLSGVLTGEYVDPQRHGICKEIKAVTRHGFSFEKKENLWEAIILFDV